MAFEATLIYETELPIPFTVANGTAITKGTLLKITDPMTAAAQSAASDVIAGIAAADKIASDGVTKLGVYRAGIFKMYLSGAANVGEPLASDAVANYCKLAPAATSGARFLGTTLETGGAGETILVDFKIGTTNVIT